MRKITAALCAVSLVLFGCSRNNVVEDDSIKQYFDEHKVTGCFGQFNNTRGEFTVYNLSRFADSAYLPASTFKIVNSLIGLETGIIANDSAVIPWNGVPWFREACNQNLPMYMAFRESCVPWYQELARRIGRDTMQFWLDSLGYGSRHGRAEISKIDTFWLDNAVKITADEQLGLAKKLYFNQLPFKRWVQGRVKSMMTVETRNEYILAYKTGTGRAPNGHLIGWVVGWIEENKHPYPFVLQLESTDPGIDMRPTALAVLDKILKHYGFKEGKK
ncbi:MAG TPA: penicillin-binding transpeptidase domain-containing protein [Chitinophagaceae bacterium]|nr:penicillin-binding transpeptidase domain-containing protein [Chitinophagaceae bacterium]